MISAEQVKNLRLATGIGMMECKKALTECDGDFEKAKDWLRAKSGSKADKLSGRSVSEGRVAYANHNNNIGALVELVCETDFVARDDNFTAFSDSCALALAKNPTATSAEKMATIMLDNGKSCEEARQELIMKLGENINIQRCQVIQAQGGIFSYIHTGGKIGTMADITGADDEFGRDICMHIAAMRPSYVSPDDVPTEALDREKEIYKTQAAESGKPAAIADNIIAGKLKKYLAENTLVGQQFVKADDTTVGSLLEQHQAKVHAFTILVAGS